MRPILPASHHRLRFWLDNFLSRPFDHWPQSPPQLDFRLDSRWHSCQSPHFPRIAWSRQSVPQHGLPLLEIFPFRRNFLERQWYEWSSDWNVYVFSADFCCLATPPHGASFCEPKECCAACTYCRNVRILVESLHAQSFYVYTAHSAKRNFWDIVHIDVFFWKLRMKKKIVFRELWGTLDDLTAIPAHFQQFPEFEVRTKNDEIRLLWLSAHFWYKRTIYTAEYRPVCPIHCRSLH